MISLRQSRREARRALAQALRNRFVRGAKDERGAVALIFALAIVVLVPLVLGFLDVYTWHEQRSRLQDSLDAATLFAARSDKNTNAEIDALGDKALLANLKLYRGAVLQASDFSLSDNNTRIVASATVQPQALAPAFWSHPPITVSTNVIRNSKNLEVALVMDLTGSMDGSKVGDLKEAAKELVDLVVKDSAQQTPYYSRMALVPWSAAVNVGSAAAQARGAVVGTRTITAISDWKTGSEINVSGATRANPVVVTTQNNHGFANDDVIMLRGVSGMTQINNVPYKVQVVNNTSFRLKTLAGANVNGSNYNNYSSSGNDKVAECVRADCTVQITATNHGYTNSDYVFVAGALPSTGLGNVINGKAYQVSGVTANTYNIFVGATWATYTAGSGASFCMKYGCEFIRFANPSGAIRIHRASTCVTERTGSEIDTDAAPSTKPLGFYYPATNYSLSNSNPLTNPLYAPTLSSPSLQYNNPCLANEVVPLSDSKATLNGKIDLMAVGNNTQGTTGGQVGTAWGWYVLSPNFSYLFSSGFSAAAYTQTDSLKVVVLMTDGALNTAYCNGVISADSTPQYAFMAPDHINCNATNGDTFTQAKALCTKMKAAKLVIYTVGFDISGDATAQSLMDHCATAPSYKFLPDSGAELKDAFRAIGADITNLRLAK